MSTHTIKIQNGRIAFVYDDALAELLTEGTATVQRVSHVEPHPTKIGWVADMRPVQGPVIGLDNAYTIIAETEEAATKIINLLTPFPTRAEALAAERVWLTQEKGL